jgi:hypothetical protein
MNPRYLIALDLIAMGAVEYKDRVTIARDGLRETLHTARGHGVTEADIQRAMEANGVQWSDLKEAVDGQ